MNLRYSDIAIIASCGDGEWEPPNPETSTPSQISELTRNGYLEWEAGGQRFRITEAGRAVLSMQRLSPYERSVFSHICAGRPLETKFNAGAALQQAIEVLRSIGVVTIPQGQPRATGLGFKVYWGLFDILFRLPEITETKNV